MEVTCHVDGCERVAMYKAKRLCQKHYFRMMRTGSYELKRKIERLVTPNGYIKVLAEGHKLSDKHGYVYEHRLVLFNKYGDSELACEKCGARWLWRPYMDHVDHIDKNKQNNKASNLRPLCNGCNTKRTKIDYTKVKGTIPITAFGKTMVAEEWARQDICTVSGYVVRNRIKAGWDAEKAITKPSRKASKIV